MSNIIIIIVSFFLNRAKSINFRNRIVGALEASIIFPTNFEMKYKFQWENAKIKEKKIYSEREVN